MVSYRQKCRSQTILSDLFKKIKLFKVKKKINQSIAYTTCYAYIQNPKKLDGRSKKGIFVGHDRESPTYLIYFPDTQEIKATQQYCWVAICSNKAKTNFSLTLTSFCFFRNTCNYI